MSEFKLRTKDIFIQKCNHDEISNLSENRLYKHLGFTNNAYLTEIKQNKGISMMRGKSPPSEF